MTSRISHHGHLGHLGHLGHDHDRTGDPPSVTESDRTAPGGSGQVRSWSCQRCFHQYVSIIVISIVSSILSLSPGSGWPSSQIWYQHTTTPPQWLVLV